MAVNDPHGYKDDDFMQFLNDDDTQMNHVSR